MCLSKYVSVFVWTYAELCRALRRHVCRHLNLALFLDLDLDLNLSLYLNPNLFLFQSSFEKPVASSFDSSIGFE